MVIRSVIVNRRMLSLVSVHLQTHCFLQITGDNIYAIYRAPKVASTEAIVFSTTLTESQFAVPLMISLCHLISKQTIWAKDVIFLVSTS